MPETLAAPTWCARSLEEGVAHLLATQSNHATLRIDTPTVDLRINIGINHQELVMAEDGRVVVPELEFWQTDIGLEWNRFSTPLAACLETFLALSSTMMGTQSGRASMLFTALSRATVLPMRLG